MATSRLVSTILRSCHTASICGSNDSHTVGLRAADKNRYAFICCIVFKLLSANYINSLGGDVQEWWGMQCQGIVSSVTR